MIIFEEKLYIVIFSSPYLFFFIISFFVFHLGNRPKQSSQDWSANLKRNHKECKHIRFLVCVVCFLQGNQPHMSTPKFCIYIYMMFCCQVHMLSQH